MEFRHFSFYLSSKIVLDSSINSGPDLRSSLFRRSFHLEEASLPFPSTSASFSLSHAFVSPPLRSVTLVAHASIKQCIFCFIITIITIIIIMVTAFLLTVVALMRAGFLKASLPSKCFRSPHVMTQHTRFSLSDD